MRYEDPEDTSDEMVIARARKVSVLFGLKDPTDHEALLHIISSAMAHRGTDKWDDYQERLLNRLLEVLDATEA